MESMHDLVDYYFNAIDLSDYTALAEMLWYAEDAYATLKTIPLTELISIRELVADHAIE